MERDSWGSLCQAAATALALASRLTSATSQQLGWQTQGRVQVILDPSDIARLEFIEGAKLRRLAESQRCVMVVPMLMHIDLPEPLHPKTLILGEPVLQRMVALASIRCKNDSARYTAQLAEIAELRGQLAQLPYVEAVSKVRMLQDVMKRRRRWCWDEIHQMEQELAELQTTIVVNTNEIELRNMEAESMGLEAARLEAAKAAARAAAEMRLPPVAVSHRRLQSEAHQSELADFFHRLDPAGPAGGRLFTEAEVQAGCGGQSEKRLAEGRSRTEKMSESVPAVAAATGSPDDAEQSDHSNPDGSFTLPEWRDFFREEGSFSTEEWIEVTGELRGRSLG
ncbi:hypothetical protein AK812_SmicGene21194 [Symbiodinium microadriaticum]|uniref:Uncharacterized protein n=1 Tax=Symbiodinium microadriaticum TaxID=2951 RepID=A0A1Q9DN20_SYMMI|nr:hypothetical protein AK812_SmicGene21194 [Symbiodinium microadriaticum]